MLKNPTKMNCKCFLLIILLGIYLSSSHAKQQQEEESYSGGFLNAAVRWRARLRAVAAGEAELRPTPAVLLAGALSFAAASISSAGGIGGGGLFLPILTIIAGLDLKTASSFSAFMVTGGSIANVVCNMITRPGGKKNEKKALIDYDIALLSEPCMLLGVSIGVICNKVFPEWLITVMFAVFLAWSTVKTFRSGVCFWKLETEFMSRNSFQKLENETPATDQLEEPLLSRKGGLGLKIDVPWMKMGLLIVIWLCFFVIYLFRGNKYGQGLISIKPCGVEYWAISAAQVPLAIVFTSCILCGRKRPASDHGHEQELGIGPKKEVHGKYLFPVMALLAGALGGLFGIGGGMLISPLLLQVGICPEITAATCSFMVLFSSTMSAFQYLLLGMDHVYSAIIFAFICFLASILGLKVVQNAIVKHGRASLIVFSVGIVMAASTILMTSFGAFDVWRDYRQGNYMGFKLPC